MLPAGSGQVQRDPRDLPRPRAVVAQRHPVEVDTADRLMTPAEVAALFRVNPRTVTRWANGKQLASVRTPGGHRRYPEKAVLALLQERG